MGTGNSQVPQLTRGSGNLTRQVNPKREKITMKMKMTIMIVLTIIMINTLRQRRLPGGPWRRCWEGWVSFEPAQVTLFKSGIGHLFYEVNTRNMVGHTYDTDPMHWRRKYYEIEIDCRRLVREISEDTTQNVAEVRKQKTNQVEENHKNVREVVKNKRSFYVPPYGQGVVIFSK